VSILLITPPFTQLNTPYPATAYLKGFLNTKHIDSHQCDLGIEVILKVFCKAGLIQVFDVAATNQNLSENAQRILALRSSYLNCIDDAILFLQGHLQTMAIKISKRNYLPEASRFNQLQDMQYAFGTMGVVDFAKYICTLFIEDISDLIQECVDTHFGFSRYAERLARSANTFDELYLELKAPLTFFDKILSQIIDEKIKTIQPNLLVITAPFPGNVYAGLRCAQFVKHNYPVIKIAFGGGFANTELRHLADERVFEFFDYVSLDDGELPIEQIIKHAAGQATNAELKRTFILQNDVVVYCNALATCDYKQHEVGTPDYSDLYLDKYIQAIEVLNPMHSLWSNGRWNKLTMAHGCYWGKCTFCDTSLPYIADYEPINAQLICDRIEKIIDQTGERGFHFVDEAAPPALMVAVAAEIIKRNLNVSWWTNVRFEKSFTRDVCLLLKASGCIAVSGGLEVASERLLKLIDKGITLEQVATVNKNFIASGIMVHAYLMYAYPTQTIQETIDSLEMVRQLFAQGVLQSGFWHQFALTVHSPVGMAPEKYNIKKTKTALGSFANNDAEFTDATGINHDLFSFGLKKSLFNYMQQIGLQDPLQNWFDFKIPITKIDKNFIANILNNPILPITKPNTKYFFTCTILKQEIFTQSKKGNSREMMTITFASDTTTLNISILATHGRWLLQILSEIKMANAPLTRKAIEENYTKNNLEDFELFWDNKPMNMLYKIGLLGV
jgi:hypothetical protein